MSRPGLLLMLVVAGGCSFNRQGLSPVDRATADRSASEPMASDLLSPDRAAADSPRPREGGKPKPDGNLIADRPRTDAKPKTDLAKPDAKPKADLARPDSLPPSCDDLFRSSVPGYVGCIAPDNSTCRFYFNAPTATSCATLCGSHPCQKMEDNDPSNTCTAESPNLCGSSPCQCATPMFDSLCTCKK